MYTLRFTESTEDEVRYCLTNIQNWQTEYTFIFCLAQSLIKQERELSVSVANHCEATYSSQKYTLRASCTNTSQIQPSIISAAVLHHSLCCAIAALRGRLFYVVYHL